VAVGELALAAATPSLAIIAAVLYATNPGAVEYSSLIVTETLFTFLVTFTFLLVSRGSFVLAGMTLGLATICRPFAIIFLVSIAIAVFVLRKPRAGRLVVAMAFSCMLIVTPWLLRCWIAAKRPVFVQVGTGQMLYVPTLVHEDQSDQAIWSKLYRSDPLLHKFIFAETASKMVDAEHVLTRQAIQNIQLAPTAYLKSRLRAVPHLFFTSSILQQRSTLLSVLHFVSTIGQNCWPKRASC